MGDVLKPVTSKMEESADMVQPPEIVDLEMEVVEQDLSQLKQDRPIPSNPIRIINTESTAIAHWNLKFDEVIKSIATVSSKVELLQRPRPIDQGTAPSCSKSTHRSLSSDDSPDLRLLFDNLKSVSEILDVPLIKSTFTADREHSKLRCRLCHKSLNSGIKLITDDDCTLIISERKIKQTRSFINFKRSIADHLKTNEHLTNSGQFRSSQQLTMQENSRNKKAGMTMALLVYQMVKTKDSYNSIEQRVTALHMMPGTYVGEINHSKAFPPVFVRTMRDVLLESLCTYLDAQKDYLGFIVPISVTADKDTSKHRARQVSSFQSFNQFLRSVWITHLDRMISASDCESLNNHRKRTWAT